MIKCGDNDDDDQDDVVDDDGDNDDGVNDMIAVITMTKMIMIITFKQEMRIRKILILSP